MSRQRLKLIFAMTVIAALAIVIAARWGLVNHRIPEETVDASRLPRLRPDYCGIVIPPNIAPLNFVVDEPGIDYRVRIHGSSNKDILIASHDPGIVIPQQPWRELLQENRGGKIGLEIYVKDIDGRWFRFGKIENAVAQEEIDSHLAYRLLGGPLGNLHSKMGIYQRNLENFDESPIMVNDSFGGCINCHMFRNNDPGTFTFQVRPGPQNINVLKGMVLVRDGHAEQFPTKSDAAPTPPGYLSWNPKNSFVVFSMNLPRQFFRGYGAEVRDVYDKWSNLAIADFDTGATATSPEISHPGRLETFPCWSADGKYIYYCSAQSEWGGDKPPSPESIKRLKYDLMRVQYNAKDNTFGPPETALAASDTGMSITEPRVSPDGRYLLCCMLDYGMFPLFRLSSDLYLLDLENGGYRRLECNSDSCEAWHSWSSNSRWIVFSSKRDHGLLARLYFSYIDADGHAHKPFILPQKDPAFNDTWHKAYNVPELITGPVNVSQKELLQAIFVDNTTVGGPAETKPSWRPAPKSQMHE